MTTSTLGNSAPAETQGRQHDLRWAFSEAEGVFFALRTIHVRVMRGRTGQVLCEKLDHGDFADRYDLDFFGQHRARPGVEAQLWGCL